MSKAAKLKIAAGAAFLFLICCYILLYPNPVSWSWRGDPVGERYHHALEIGNALLHFQEDHPRQLPKHLSDLVPRYIGVSNINCLFWPPLKKSAISNLGKIEILRGKIDNEGAFIYLGSAGSQIGLILYECPVFWPKNENLTNVTTLMTTNFLPRLLSVSELKEYLRLLKY